MKTRYFSPTSIKSIQKSISPNEKNLCSAKSVSKLPISIPIIQKKQQRVGKYTYNLNKLLGKGFSSQVYLGYQTDNQQAQCAVKAIDLRNFRSTDLELLQNQISILKKLKHPNILQLYQVINTTSFCYIITQCCIQKDLRVHLQQKGKLNEQQSLVVLHDIIEGYKYLIKNNIIHRDLKPANIFRGSLNWKIGDFGFAIRNHKEHKAKINVGTPLYMPPQSLVKNLYSAKSDIFAIGIIFYEALTGTTPWKSRTQLELLRKMLNVPFSVPSQYRLSYEIKNILQKLCCVDLKQRMNKDTFLKFTVFNIYNQTTLHRGNVTLAEESDESLSLNLSPSSSQSQLNSSSLSSLKLAALISPKNQFQSLLRNQTQIGSPKLSSTKMFSKQRNSKIKYYEQDLSIINNNLSNNLQFKKISEEDFTYNNKIIVNQLHYCRFIYYIIKNSYAFSLNGDQKIQVCLMLFQHLLKLIKILLNNLTNFFDLRCWKEFIKSKRYQKTLKTLNEYSNRYNLQYQMYLSSFQKLNEDQLKNLREIFKETQSFSMMEYHFIKNKFTEVIKRYIIQIQNDFNKQLTLKQRRVKIQGFVSLIKYRKLVQMSLSHYEQYEHFEKQSDLKVHNDYSKVTSATKEAYFVLKKQLSFL